MNKVDIQMILVSVTLGKFVFLNPRGARGQNSPEWPKIKLFAPSFFFRSLNFSETFQKHEQSRYTNDFGIRDTGKICVCELQGVKGSKWPKMKFFAP